MLTKVLHSINEFTRAITDLRGDVLSAYDALGAHIMSIFYPIQLHAEASQNSKRWRGSAYRNLAAGCG